MMLPFDECGPMTRRRNLPLGTVSASRGLRAHINATYGINTPIIRSICPVSAWICPRELAGRVHGAPATARARPRRRSARAPLRRPGHIGGGLGPVRGLSPAPAPARRSWRPTRRRSRCARRRRSARPRSAAGSGPGRAARRSSLARGRRVAAVFGLPRALAPRSPSRVRKVILALWGGGGVRRPSRPRRGRRARRGCRR